MQQEKRWDSGVDEPKPKNGRIGALKLRSRIESHSSVAVLPSPESPKRYNSWSTMTPRSASQRYLSTRGGSYDVSPKPNINPPIPFYSPALELTLRSLSSPSKTLFSKASPLTVVYSSLRKSQACLRTGGRNGGISRSQSWPWRSFHHTFLKKRSRGRT